MRPATAAALLALGFGLCEQPSGQELRPACDASAVTFEQPPFAAFDSDGDGAIAESEADGCETLATLFDRLDLDANGVLTTVEYAGFAALWRNRARTFGEDAP